jgi:4-hydroxythreonine-4-phosphate dehydrogenase
VSSKPRIGITLGDPAGIGPEVVRAALASGRLSDDFEYTIVGDSDAFIPGVPTKESAQHAFAALEEAASLVLNGGVSAIVTGPVSKKGLHEVGFKFPGQTEFFAARANVSNYAMCLTGGKITVALVTAHVPLKDVSSLLTKEEIVRTGLLLAKFLQRKGVPSRRVAVAGLNPHAGEGGDLGREEIEIIQPALQILQQRTDVGLFEGPFSPDTLFHQVAEGAFDGVLCMYHDQGLIPLKLHAFDQGVNITLGLPFVRTSPDHGTAFDLAGKGVARPDSMIAAIQLASDLIRNV